MALRTKLVFGGFACLVLSAQMAAAQPASIAVSPTGEDLDGDGQNDRVELRDSDKSVVISLASGATQTFRHGFAKGTVIIGGAADSKLVAVYGTNDDGELAAIVVSAQKGHLTELWRGVLGPMSDDGEYATHLEFVRGLYLATYQTRSDVSRCDSHDVRLFENYFDEKKQAWAPPGRGRGNSPSSVVPQPIDGKTPRTSAVFALRSQSITAGARDASQMKTTAVLTDGNPATTWHARSSDARDAFFTFRSRIDGQHARAVVIAQSEKSKARVATIEIIGTGPHAQFVDLPDTKSTEWFIPLPASTGSCITIEIAKVANEGDVSLGELVVLGDADLADGGAAQALVQQVRAGGSDADDASRSLVMLGAPAAAALQVAIAQPSTDAAQRRRLLHSFAKLANFAPAAAASAIIVGDLAGADADDAIATMARAGTSASPELASIARATKVCNESRIAALAALAQMPASDTHLMDLAGQMGASPVDAARAQLDGTVATAFYLALASRPVATLVLSAGSRLSPWLTVVKPPHNEDTFNPAAADSEKADRALKERMAADLWRGATVAATHAAARDDGQAIAAATVTPMVATLPAASNYPLRYRLVQGIARLGSDVELHQLAGWLDGLPQNAERDALWQIAMMTLAQSQARGAIDLAVHGISQAAPGVRLAALATLATLDENHGAHSSSPWVTNDAGVLDQGVDHVVIAALENDAWPAARRAAAGALGARCVRAEQALALEQSMNRDHEVTVRAESLAAWIRCKPADVTAKLSTLIRNHDAPPPLRERAIDALAQLDDPQATAGLIALFNAWRGAAFNDGTALSLAIHAASALGHVTSSSSVTAVNALLAATHDDALPELVAAVAAALGNSPSPCTAPVKPALNELAHSEQRMVALSAEQALATCKK